MTKAKRSPRRAKARKRNTGWRAKARTSGNSQDEGALPPVDPHLWVATFLGPRRASGRPPLGSRIFHVPDSWGDWRALSPKDRKREWLCREYVRQEARLGQLEARKGPVPKGGWRNAIDRTEGMLRTLKEVGAGKKDVILAPMDDFRDRIMDEADPEKRLRRWRADLLALLDKAADVRVFREPLPDDPDLYTNGTVMPSRLKTVYCAVRIGKRAPHWAHDAAAALQFIESAMTSRERHSWDDATDNLMQATRYMERVRVQRAASESGERGRRKKTSKKEQRYKRILAILAEEKRRNEAIRNPERRLHYLPLRKRVARRYSEENPTDPVGVKTIENAVAWGKKTGYAVSTSS